jgi:hypothetical protein
VIAAGALILVAASACEIDPSAEPGGAPSGPPSSGPVSSGPISPGPPASPGPPLIMPTPAENIRPVRWNRVEAVPGGNDVLVHGTMTPGPPCAVLAKIDVRETTSTVTITVWVGQQPGADCTGPQPQVAMPFVTRVRLSSPLAQRRAVDGAG